MQCPYCNSANTAVIDSRDAHDAQAIRRRRVCEDCQRRFTTYERVESLDLKVVKKDGSEENFSREKIRRGLIKSTWKRPLTIEEIDKLVDEVECKLRQRDSRQIKSWEIGNLVINRLKKIDQLSYLLFACVYRDFDSIEDFEQEINKLKTQVKDT